MGATVSPMPRPRSFATDDAVAGAMALFWRRGYATATPARLEAATGLGRSSLYNAFGSKHALFLTALRRYVATESARLSTVLDGPGTPLERLRDGLRLVADAVAADAEGIGCLVTTTASELAREDLEAAAIVAGLLTAQRTALARAVAAGQASGELADDVDPATAADLLLTTTNGLRVLSRSGSPVADPRAVADLALHALER